jgi:hypothetical protein
MTTATRPLPLRAAAAQMGISTDTLRKRLQRGLTPGQKVDGQWFVAPSPGPDLSGSVLDSRCPGPDQTGHVQDQPDAPPEAQNGALLSDRAGELARFSQQLLAPYVAQIAELSQRVGQLEAELAAARGNGQAETQSAPPAEAWPAARSWWQKLLWG